MSTSKLRQFARKPEAFVAVPLEDRSTPAMKKGRLFHTLLLTPGQFHKEYFLKDDLNLHTKEGRAAKKELEAAGLSGVTMSEIESCQRMIQAVLDNPVAMEYLTGEVEVTTLFDWMGVECKARQDVLDKPRRILADIKTTKSVVPKEFERSVWKLGYFQQMAWYLRSVEDDSSSWSDWSVAIIAVETNYPHIVVTYLFDMEYLLFGDDLNCRQLESYCLAKDLGSWYSHCTTVPMTLSLPPFVEPIQ